MSAETDELLKRVNPTIKQLLDAHRQMILGDFGDAIAREKYTDTFNRALRVIVDETMP